MKSFFGRCETFFMPLRMAVKLGTGWIFSHSRCQILDKSYSVLWSIAIGNRKAVLIPLTFNGTTFAATFESSSDFALVREVFLDEEYKHQYISDARAIFDVGANVGMASLYFACLYPNARIYAFEPNPLLFPKLVKQVAIFNNIQPFPYALADVDGEVILYVSPVLPLSGSLIERNGVREAHTVQARSISSITNELEVKHIDILKFDIEGGEKALFQNSENRQPVERLIGEVHLDLIGMDKNSFKALFIEFDTEYVRMTAENRYIFFGTKA